MKDTTCVVPECQRTDIKGRAGYCNMHRQRVKRYGDPYFVKQVKTHPSLCTYPDCIRPYLYKGFCSIHYQRLRRHGDPTKKLNRDAGTGTVDKHGYIHIKIHGDDKLLHRVLMEKKLGRSLLPSEVVHHIDCEPSHNSLENLEIMDRSVHTKLHSVLAALLSLDTKGLRHLNNHLKRHGFHLYLQQVMTFPSSSTVEQSPGHVRLR